MATPRVGHVDAPKLPQGTISLQPPPDVVEGQGPGGLIAMVVPMFGSMGVMVFMALSNSSNPRMILMAGFMVVAMVAMVGFTTHRQISQHRNKVNAQRREYLAYLAELREEVRRGARDQRRYATWQMPDPRALPMIVQQGERLWERPRDRDDTYLARVGTTSQPLVLDITEPELGPLANADPVCLSAVSRFVKTFQRIDDLPSGINISEHDRVEIVGAPDDGRALARTILVSLTTLLSPELLTVAAIVDDAARAQWDWLKWLPHARADATDAVGRMRLIGGSAAEVLDLLPEEVFSRPSFRAGGGATTPQVVIVVDGVLLSDEDRERLSHQGVCVLYVAEQWGTLDSHTAVRLMLKRHADGELTMELVRLSGSDVLTPDLTPLPSALTVARKMAKYTEGTRESVEKNAAGSGSTADPTRSADLLELLHLGDIRDYNPAVDVTRREGTARLRVPFGISPDGVPISLDLKESAQGGMGPHGLLIGATGSGKSEVLRTIVLAMVLTHSPEQLNLVLVDFKGGATFAGMSDLPHVSATITNLERELSLVDRMEEALHGEMVRRQEQLRAAGNYANVRDYEQARLAGRHNHPPLPALFIILDEFSELLTAKPEFIDTFVTIGRLGRSLEVHLLLSTQRLEESRLRGLESHLSYRVGLRTFSAMDSRAVLGTADAFNLPTVPGVGFLKTAGEGMKQFRASYVSGPPKPRKAAIAAARATAVSRPRILPFTAAPVLSRDPEPQAVEPEPQQEEIVLAGDAQWNDMSILEIAVKKIAPILPRAHRVWLDPLEIPDSLDTLFGDLTITREYGLHSPSWRAKGRLTVPLGMKDVPREQRREVNTLELTGGAGHVAVLGGPQSGKSTALRTLVMALSLVNTPREAQFYVLDFGSGVFTPFRGGAHIAGVATRDQPDVVARTLAEIRGIMADREAYFTQHGIDSMQTYRRGRGEGRYDDGYGDVFLVIDGWDNMKTDFPEADRTVETILSRALALGVHIVVATPRLGDLRMPLQGFFGTVVELRLGDPRDSRFDSKTAGLVPEGMPGRGVSPSLHHMLVALPRIDGSRDVTTLAEAVAHALGHIRDAWMGQPGPKLRLLPEHITLDEVRALAGGAPRVLLGLDETRLAPLALDLRAEPHLYLFGDSKTGKTNTLRTIMQEVMRTNEPQHAQFFLVDFRRTLLQQVPDVYLAGYYATHEVATAAMQQVAALLKQRLPGADVTPQQLRERSWWKGPEFYIVVDDYELVSTSAGNPLAPLVDLLAQANDLGLHVLLARRSGGASRVLYEPMIRGLVDVGAPALLLPGNPEEGALVGKVKPRPGPAGRGQFITREAGLQLVQVAASPEA